MKLNDFQYNWYLHFEEENEKSIVGLPFDPYFEAHKFDEESILGFVERAKRMRQLRTRWISVFIDTWNKIESFWEAFKNHHDILELFVFKTWCMVLTIPLVAGLMGNNLWYITEAFDYKPLFCKQGISCWFRAYHFHPELVGILARIGYVIWNYFLMIIAVCALTLPLGLLYCILRDVFGVKIKRKREDFAEFLPLNIVMCLCGLIEYFFINKIKSRHGFFAMITALLFCIQQH